MVTFGLAVSTAAVVLFTALAWRNRFGPRYTWLPWLAGAGLFVVKAGLLLAGVNPWLAGVHIWGAVVAAVPWIVVMRVRRRRMAAETAAFLERRWSAGSN